jgi:hypothetical protein
MVASGYGVSLWARYSSLVGSRRVRCVSLAGIRHHPVGAISIMTWLTTSVVVGGDPSGRAAQRWRHPIVPPPFGYRLRGCDVHHEMSLMVRGFTVAPRAESQCARDRRSFNRCG